MGVREGGDPSITRKRYRYVLVLIFVLGLAGRTEALKFAEQVKASDFPNLYLKKLV